MTFRVILFEFCVLGAINVFLNEKRFLGLGGQEITAEVMATVAGIACLLLFVILNVPFDATASLQEKTTRILDGIENNWHEANLRVWTNAGQTKSFKLGEEIKFYFPSTLGLKSRLTGLNIFL